LISSGQKEEILFKKQLTPKKKKKKKKERKVIEAGLKGQEHLHSKHKTLNLSKTKEKKNFQKRCHLTPVRMAFIKN
jgi:hypothetical protein